MTLPTSVPLYSVPAPTISGQPFTGQQPTTPGGQRSWSSPLSGLGASGLLVISGPGRLDTVTMLSRLTSGHGVFLVDRNTVGETTSGFQSGDIYLATVPATWGNGLQSGQTPDTTWWVPRPVGAVFQNGLTAVPANSGTNVFSLTYSLDQTSGKPF